MNIEAKSIEIKALVELNIENIDLSEIDMRVVAMSIARLNKVYLKWSRLTKHQIHWLFCEIKKVSGLEVFSLSHTDLSYLPDTTLTEAVCNSSLTRVILTNAGLSHAQCTTIFNHVDSSKLKALSVHGSDIHLVQAPLLSKPVNHLTSLNLWKTNLTHSQCSHLLQILPNSSTLRNLNLGHVDLSQLPSQSLCYQHALQLVF